PQVDDYGWVRQSTCFEDLQNNGCVMTVPPGWAKIAGKKIDLPMIPFAGDSNALDFEILDWRPGSHRGLWALGDAVDVDSVRERLEVVGRIDDRVVLQGGPEMGFIVSGWAIDPIAESTAAAVFLNVN